MALTIAQFRSTPLVVGGYGGATAGNAPILRDVTALGAALPQGGVTDKHLVQIHPVALKYTVAPDATVGFAGRSKVSFADAAVGDDTAFLLPFVANNISSMPIDTTADMFFTDNLSGCSIFIDAMPGQCVVYHANVLGGVYMPTVQEAADNSFEKQNAIARKKQFHQIAKAHYPGTVFVGELFKQTYNHNNNRAASRSLMDKIKHRSVGGFGTTVAGWRNGNDWEFWYQTWKNKSGVVSVIRAEKFAECTI